MRLKHFLIGLFIGCCMVLFVTAAMATTNDHCGPNGFSPPAPPEMCHNTVPEPATWGLIILACILVYVMRRRK